MLFLLSLQIIQETTDVEAHHGDGLLVVTVFLDPSIHSALILDLDDLPQQDFHIFFMNGLSDAFQFMRLPFLQCRDPNDRTKFWIQQFEFGIMPMSEFVVQFMKDVRSGAIDPIQVFV
ncbi:Hypothetical_protein [Hexamita inflata]|uniref:Hypothetical_protein n=1 Tax=Hexamita inflata TaxID=28002 RepID=A0AA86QU13_9EUKA|nr:Hypothetical protein HINF_LOCUS53691 [Hexamita inflata]